MIYVLCLCAVVCASLAVFYVLIHKVGKLEDMLISLSLEVAHLKDGVDESAVSIEHFEKRIVDMETAVESIDEGTLAEVLEKKWDDAIQVISNFDPFHTEDEK